MSGRWSLDDDDQAFDDVRPNATCTDCGTDFSRATHDVGTLCDGCCDQRDTHTSALELRMAKADLPARTAVA